MKKKLMMVAVLLGALTLGACVDDNESASVTAIRNAKAAQLEAMAAVDNANAALITATAEAEAAIKAAEARLKAAQADKAEQELEEAKQEFALELEALKAKYEAQVAKFNSLKAQYEQNLWYNEDQTVKKVYDAYARALDNINTLTSAKLEAQVRKAQAEAEVISAEETVKQTLASYNKQLTQKQNLLAKLQEMQAMQPSTEDYEKQMVELEKQAYDIVVNQKPEAEAAEHVAKEAYEDIVEAVTEGEYKFAAAAEALNEMANNYLYTYQDFADANSIAIAEDECDAYYDEWGGYPDGTFSVTMYELTNSQVQSATLAADRAFEQKLKDADDDIEAAKGEEWETDDDDNIIWGSESTSLNGAKSAVAYYEQQIKAKDEEIADKEDELNQAIEDEEPEATINRLKGELELLKTQKEGLTDDKENAEVAVTKAEETLAEKEEDKKEIEEKQKEYTDNLAILNDATALKEYQDAFATIEPKAIEYINAQAKVQPFDDALQEIGITEFNADGSINTSTGIVSGGQYDYLQSLVSNAIDIADLIDDCNTDIVAIQNIIEMGALNELVSLQPVTKWIYNYVTGQSERITVYHYVITSGVAITAADAVAIIDAEIAALDAKIETEQAMANSYKEKLAELLNTAAEEPAEEETPAA